MLVTEIPRIYYPYACLICLRSQTNTKRCSNCKIVAYCSRSHQILDWKRSHKKICKIITAFNQKFTPNIKNFKEWSNYRIARGHVWETKLERRLNLQETMMNQFSPRCAVCFSEENLYCCKDCLNVSFCSEDHEVQYSFKHKKFCDKFRLSLITDQYINLKGLPDVEFYPEGKEALNCTHDILKYISFTQFISEHDYLTKQQELLAFEIMKTERVALGLNLFYALKLIQYTKKKLIVHIVGASDLELETNWSVVTKILSNWLEISHVTYYFVGPDLNRKIPDEEFDNYQIIHHSCLYHEIINKIDKPDLVLAFNCGLHEYENEKDNPWQHTTPKLMYYENVPLVLTSFTEVELIRDKNIVQSLNYKLDIIHDVQKNPFAFLKPLRDWLSKDEPIFYRCNYIYIVQRLE